MVRATGWTFQQAWDQPANECFALLEHLEDFPPEYVILADVHMKPGVQRSRRGVDDRAESEREADQAMRDGMAATGGPLPPELRELMAWSTEQQAKMRKR